MLRLKLNHVSKRGHRTQTSNHIPTEWWHVFTSPRLNSSGSFAAVNFGYNYLFMPQPRLISISKKIFKHHVDLVSRNIPEISNSAQIYFWSVFIISWKVMLNNSDLCMCQSPLEFDCKHTAHATVQNGMAVNLYCNEKRDHEPPPLPTTPFMRNTTNNCCKNITTFY